MGFLIFFKYNDLLSRSCQLLLVILNFKFEKLNSSFCKFRPICTVSFIHMFQLLGHMFQFFFSLPKFHWAGLVNFFKPLGEISLISKSNFRSNLVNAPI